MLYVSDGWPFMKLYVKVKPGSKKEQLREIDPAHFEIWTKAPPIEDRANLETVKILARHLGVPKSRIKIVAGRRSRQKVFMVSN